MRTNQQSSALLPFLRALPPVGSGSFEELVALLLERVTGEVFRPARSGDQFGRDIANEPHGSRVYVEVKRYGERRRLDPVGIRDKLQQAISHNPPDLWVLVTTQKVSDQLRQSLHDLAVDKGVDVLVLDFTTDGVSTLAVLMAGVPDVVSRWTDIHGGSPSAICEELSAIRSDCAFGQIYSRICSSLHRRLIGYDAARKRCCTKLIEVLSSPAECRALFKQPAAVRSEAEVVISRRHAKDMDHWWNQDSHDRGACAVIGEEGMGKTWLTFDWLAALACSDDPPIILVASSANIDAERNLLAVLANQLCFWTGVRDSAFWERRLCNWLEGPSTGEKPLIVLCIDGLSERPGIKWPHLLSEHESRQLRLAVALLVTDREKHWEECCASVGKTQSIRVEGFTPAERALFFQRHNVDLPPFEADAERVLSRPSLAAVVPRNFSQLMAARDFSVERIVLLEAKERHSRRISVTISFNDFVDSIVHLARQHIARQRSSLADLRTFAGYNQELLQDIIDGKLTERDESVPYKYRINPQFAVLGLSLLLLSTAQDCQAKGWKVSEIREEVDKFLELLSGSDVMGRIISTATCLGFHEPSHADVRAGLLGAWLGSRNIDEQGIESVSACFPKDPKIFIQTAERVWSESSYMFDAREFLADTFIRFGREPEVKDTLGRTLCLWLGLVWIDGRPGGDQPDAAVNGKPVMQALDEANALMKKRFNETIITVTDNERMAQLRWVAWKVIAAGEVSPFVDSLIVWAYRLAIVSRPDDFSFAAWALRMAPDQIADRVVQEAEILLGCGALGRRAADMLCSAVGTAEALSIAQKCRATRTVDVGRDRGRALEDPCLAWGSWSDSDCIRCMNRMDIHCLAIAEKLEFRPYLPHYEVTEEYIERCQQEIIRACPSAWRSRGRTIEDTLVESLLPVLAARRPQQAVKAVQALFTDIEQRTVEELHALSFCLSSHILAADAGQRGVLVGLVRRASHKEREGDPQLEGADVSWERNLLFSLAPCLEPSVLAELIISRRESFTDEVRLESAFGALPETAIAKVVDGVNSGQQVIVGRCLWLLGRNAEAACAAIGREKVLRLCSGDNDVIRALGMRLVYLSGDTALARSSIDNMCYGPPALLLERVWRCRLMSAFGSHLTMAQMCARLSPPDVSHLIVAEHPVGADIDQFALIIDRAVREVADRSTPGGTVGLPESRDQRGSSRTAGTPSSEGTGEDVVVLPSRGEARKWLSEEWSPDLLAAIYRRDQALVRNWIERLYEPGVGGLCVLEDMTEFAIAMGTMLIKESPCEGWRLLSHLKRRLASWRRIDLAELAMCAADHEGWERSCGVCSWLVGMTRCCSIWH